MKKIFLIVLIALISIECVSSQSFRKTGYNEIGFGLSSSFLLSDLGGGNKIGTPFISDIDFKATRLGFSAYYKRNLNDRLGLKFQGGILSLYADDLNIGKAPNGSDQWFRYIRNLRAKVFMIELNILGEFNFLPFIVGESRKRMSKKWTPYFSVGFGGFKNFTKIDPTNSGNWIRAGKNGVETEDYQNNNPHKKLHLNLLSGAGIKVNLGEYSKVTIDFSLLYRQTFTDYIEDVSTVYNENTYSNSMQYHPDIATWVAGESVHAANSTSVGQQRGDSSNKDKYFSFNVGMSFRLYKQKYGCFEFQ